MLLHVAIAFDNNYLLPAYALLSSIFCNNPQHEFHFHCILVDISENEKLNLKNYIERYHVSKVQIYQLEKALFEHFPTLNRWNTSPYLKIFFPLLVDKSIDKLLFLDTDMIVVGNLNELYEIDLGEHPVGVVKDNYVKSNPFWELHLKDNYFNTGMLLINLPVWNTLRISQRAIEFATKYPDKIFYVDQDALNAVMEDRQLLLPEKYNLLYTYIPQSQSKKFYSQFIKDKVIIHFTLQKPWHLLCKNPYRYL